MQSLHSAVAVADELVGQPRRWRARAALGRVAYAFGEDDVASSAYEEAGALVDSFAATLAPERAASLQAAPEVEEIASLAGRRAVG